MFLWGFSKLQMDAFIRDYTKLQYFYDWPRFNITDSVYQGRIFMVFL